MTFLRKLHIQRCSRSLIYLKHAISCCSRGISIPLSPAFERRSSRTAHKRQIAGITLAQAKLFFALRVKNPTPARPYLIIRLLDYTREIETQIGSRAHQFPRPMRVEKFSLFPSTIRRCSSIKQHRIGACWGVAANFSFSSSSLLTN